MDQVSILIKLNLIVFSGLNNNIIKRLLLQEKLKIMVSFLVLGEICGESLALIKKIDESDPKSKDLDEIFDPDTRKKLRTKFEIIQSKCVKKAKESLERYLQFKLPTAVATVVADIVFENLFYVREDWNKAEEISKFEEVDKEDLEMLQETRIELRRLRLYELCILCRYQRPVRETVWSKFSKLKDDIEKDDSERFYLFHLTIYVYILKITKLQRRNSLLQEFQI